QSQHLEDLGTGNFAFGVPEGLRPERWRRERPVGEIFQWWWQRARLRQEGQPSASAAEGRGDQRFLRRHLRAERSRRHPGAGRAPGAEDNGWRQAPGAEEMAVKTSKPFRQLPGRGGLNDLGKSQRTINDYSKISPIVPTQPNPAEVRVLQIPKGKR